MVSDRQAESLDADTDADGDGDGSSSMDDAVQLRSAYVLHVLNHVLKARSKQVKHNARVRKAELAAAGQSLRFCAMHSHVFKGNRYSAV